MIVSLDNANATALSYKTIVEGNDADDTMSEYKKESTRMKARYLGQAYRFALDSMPYKTWNDCCQEAINQLAAVPAIRYIKNTRVLERWNVGSFVKGKHFVSRTRTSNRQHLKHKRGKENFR